MIVSGEVSGDALGADLVTEINRLRPESTFFGAAGPKMRAAGVDPTFNSEDWSVVGVGAVVQAVPKFLRIKRELLRIANERKPDAVILIDFPEFNLKLAQNLKSDGHRVIYYVSPQLWAWRQYRIKTIRKCVDLLLAILPFEVDWYAERGVSQVKFVGNPVAARTIANISREEFCQKLGLDSKRPLIALLPGSRLKEIERHLSVMLSAADLVKASYPDAQFVVSAANDKTKEKIKELIVKVDRESTVSVTDDTLNLLSAADATAIASGTATLEAGVIGTPMVVVYKVPKLDHLLFRNFVDVPHFALINLVAGERIANELMQNELTAENVADELGRLLTPEVNDSMRRLLKNAAAKLGESSPSAKAAEAVIEFLGSVSA